METNQITQARALDPSPGLHQGPSNKKVESAHEQAFLASTGITGSGNTPTTDARSSNATNLRGRAGQNLSSRNELVDQSPQQPSGKAISYYGRRFAAENQDISYDELSPQPTVEDTGNKNQAGRQQYILKEQKVAVLPRGAPDQKRNTSYIQSEEQQSNNKYQLEMQMNQNLMKEFEGMCLDGAESEVSGFGFADNQSKLKTEKKRSTMLPQVGLQNKLIPTKKSKTGGTAARPKLQQNERNLTNQSVSSFEHNNQLGLQDMKMYQPKNRPSRLPPTQPPKFINMNAQKAVKQPLIKKNSISRSSLQPAAIARRSPMTRLVVGTQDNATLPKGINQSFQAGRSINKLLESSKNKKSELSPVNMAGNMMRLKRNSSQIHGPSPTKLLTSQASIVSQESICFETGVEHIKNCKKYHPVPVHAEAAQLKYIGRACGCKRHGNQGHERDCSQDSNKSEKWNKNFLSSGACRKHKITKCPKCISQSRSPSVDSRAGRSSSISSFKSPQRGMLVSNKLLKNRASQARPKILANHDKPLMKKALSRKAPKREIMQTESRKTITPKQSDIPVRSRQSLPSSRNSNARSSTIANQRSSGANMYFPRNEHINLPGAMPITSKSKQPSLPNTDEYGTQQPIRPSSSTRYSAHGPQLRDKLNTFKRFGNRPGSQKPKKNSIRPDSGTMRRIADMSKTGDNFGAQKSAREALTGIRADGRQAMMERVATAKSNASRIQRLQTAKSIHQVDPDKHSIVDSAIRKIAQEWENANPEQEDFWKKFENNSKKEDDDLSEQKMALRGTNHLKKQGTLLSKQKGVLNQLTDRDAMSVFGTSPNNALLNQQDSFMEGDEIQGDEPIRPNFDEMLLENQEMPARIFTSQTTPAAGPYDDEPQPPKILTNLVAGDPSKDMSNVASRVSKQSAIPPTIDEQSSHPSHSLAIAPSQRSKNQPENRYNKSFKDSEVPTDEENDADDERFKDQTVDEAENSEYDDEMQREHAELKSQGRITNYDVWLDKQALEHAERDMEEEIARQVKIAAEGPQRPTSASGQKDRASGDSQLDGIVAHDAQASEGPPRYEPTLPTPVNHVPPKTAEAPQPYQNMPAEMTMTMGSSQSSKGILKKPSTRLTLGQAPSTRKPSDVHHSIKQFLDAEDSDDSGDADSHMRSDSLVRIQDQKYADRGRNAPYENMKNTASTFNDRVTFSDGCGLDNSAKINGRPPRSPDKLNKKMNAQLPLLNQSQDTGNETSVADGGKTPYLGQPPSLSRLQAADEDPYAARPSLTVETQSQETNEALREYHEQNMNKARPSTQNNKNNRDKGELFKGKASRTHMHNMHNTDERNPPAPVNDYVNINDQIKDKAEDYDPSNEGMSASYYRMREQPHTKTPAKSQYEADVSGDNTSENLEKMQQYRKAQAIKQMAIQKQQQQVLIQKSSQESFKTAERQSVSISPDKKYVSPVKRINKNASNNNMLQSQGSRTKSNDPDSVERSTNRLYKQETISSELKRKQLLAYSGTGKDVKPPKPFKIKKVSIKPTDQNPMELAEQLGLDEPLAENNTMELSLPREPQMKDSVLKEPSYVNERHEQPAEPVSMELLNEPMLHSSELNTNNLEMGDDTPYSLPPAEPQVEHSDRPLTIIREQEPEPSEQESDFYENESNRPLPDHEEMAGYLKPQQSGRNNYDADSSVRQSVIPDGGSRIPSTYRSNVTNEEEFKEVMHSQGVGTDFGEFGEAVLDSEDDEDDDRFESTKHVNSTKVTIGIQTSSKYFSKIEKTKTFQMKKQARLQSVDWAESTLYNDEIFAKKKNAFFRNFDVEIQNSTEEGGNQVEAEEIELETQLQILSPTECAYNVDFLKRKIQGREKLKEDKLHELFSLGLNTLEATMILLKLQSEWQYNTKALYQQELATQTSGHMDAHMIIKLLSRCKRMYDCKSIMTRILRLVIQRQDSKRELRALSEQEHDPEVYRKKYKDFRLLSQRLQAQINTMQEEHKIFKRPFIFYGKDYIATLREENDLLSQAFDKAYYIDESFTTKTNSKHQETVSKQTSKQEQMVKHQEAVARLQDQLLRKQSIYKTTSSATMMVQSTSQQVHQVKNTQTAQQQQQQRKF